MALEAGTAARRGFWLAAALVVLSLCLGLMAPVSGAAGAIFWLAVAWGIRRGMAAAALSATVMMALDVAVAALEANTGIGVGAMVFSILFSGLCGYFFLRTVLALKNDSGAWRGGAAWAICLAAIGLFWLSFVPYSMASASMEKTVLQDELLLVERASVKLGRLPGRGQMVVFHYPVDPKEIYVKRVVGIPGDRIRLVNKQLFRNGAAVAEPYATHTTTYVDAYRDNFPAAAPPKGAPPRGLDMLQNHVQNGEVVVPPGNYFVLGDSRDDSLDSRYWGFLPAGLITGRPLLVYGSYDLQSGGAGKSLATAFNTRWNRLFRIL
jgi:signal peptidase I